MTRAKPSVSSWALSLLGVALLATSPSAEVWICTQADGTELYSDRNATGQCQPLRSEPLQQLSPPIKTPLPSVDDRKVDGQGEQQKLSRYEIPFEAYKGGAKGIIISVKFNDAVTVRMLLDTGATTTFISPKLAEKLGVFHANEGKLLTSAEGVGGSVPTIRTIIDKVQVGGASDHFIPTTVSFRSISDSYEGLIGMDFMSKYSMKIEYGKKVIVFEEIPPDPNSKGGHDEQWWRSFFKEFNYYRDGWREYGEYIDKQIRDNPMGIGGVSDPGTFKELKKLADYQYTQADKLLSRLEHYASEHFVPRHWR